MMRVLPQLRAAFPEARECRTDITGVDLPAYRPSTGHTHTRARARTHTHTDITGVDLPAYRPSTGNICIQTHTHTHTDRARTRAHNTRARTRARAHTHTRTHAMIAVFQCAIGKRTSAAPP